MAKTLLNFARRHVLQKSRSWERIQLPSSRWGNSHVRKDNSRSGTYGASDALSLSFDFLYFVPVGMYTPDASCCVKTPDFNSTFIRNIEKSFVLCALWISDLLR